jgi:hypothetical protein
MAYGYTLADRFKPEHGRWLHLSREFLARTWQTDILADRLVRTWLLDIFTQDMGDGYLSKEFLVRTWLMDIP